MTAHLSSGQIARYLDRTLPAGEISAVLEHVEGCQDCRDRLEDAAFERLPLPFVPVAAGDADPHLTEDEMVAFVSGRLTEGREEALTHLAGCEECAGFVGAMEAVRDHGTLTSTRKAGRGWYAMGGAIAAALLVAAGIGYWSGRAPKSAPASAVIASLRDGDGQVELDANGGLRGLQNAAAGERELVAKALQERALPAGPRGLAEAPGVLLAPGAAIEPTFALSGPVNVRVLSDRPVFTWEAYPAASDYQVVVTDEKLDPVARSERITATRWEPGKALPRGVVLWWQVRAWRGGEMVSAPAPPAPPARFEIADEASAKRIEQVRGSPGASHLLLAVLCAKEGLADEARKELDVLAQENPGSAIVAALRAQRGR